MIICDNLNTYSFDLSFISPEGKLTEFVANSSKWSTTSLTTIRYIHKLIAREVDFIVFEDTLCNHLGEFKKISLVIYRYIDDDKMNFVMFDYADPLKIEFINGVKEELKRRWKNVKNNSDFTSRYHGLVIKT